MQRGQIIELRSTGPNGQRVWAYRYRVDGRGLQRVQRGGFVTADDARAALQRALAAAHGRRGLVRVTLNELVEEYLAQHDAQPETTAKLRWLLGKFTAVFGSTPLAELDAREIAAWRMTLPAGHRFEATQALRQTLARAVEWGLIDTNPAKTGVDNPQPPRREMHPFESHDRLARLAAARGPRYGADDPVRRRHGTPAWRMDRARARRHRRRATSRPCLPRLPRQSPQGHQDRDTARRTAATIGARGTRSAPDPNQRDVAAVPRRRRRLPRPPQLAAAAFASRAARRRHHADARVYDLRHTFATFALRAGLGTFELSRYMGTSLIPSTGPTGTWSATATATPSNCSTATAGPISAWTFVDVRWTSRAHP